MRPEDTELAAGEDTLDIADGMYLSYEHNWLCVRNEKGWLLWSAEGNAMPAKGFTLRSIVMEAAKNFDLRLPLNPAPSCGR
jgi:hypothetical protein